MFFIFHPDCSYPQTRMVLFSQILVLTLEIICFLIAGLTVVFEEISPELAFECVNTFCLALQLAHLTTNHDDKALARPITESLSKPATNDEDKYGLLATE